VNSTTWTPRWPLDFESSINRYARWGADFVTVVDQGALYRVCSTGSPYRIRQLDNGSIEVAGEDDLEPAVEESRFRFAETLEREAVVALGERIPAIGQQLARIPGYRPPMNAAVLESLVASICTQQVNLQWAATTRARLVERFGVRHGFAGVDVWAFPAAKILAAADPGEIRAMQFTTRKSEYIVDVAQRWQMVSWRDSKTTRTKQSSAGSCRSEVSGVGP
jgi:3-methyladenine DNA glycosylase/8-oxoguanine DNA glycosylase